MVLLTIGYIYHSRQNINDYCFGIATIGKVYITPEGVVGHNVNKCINFIYTQQTGQYKKPLDF